MIRIPLELSDVGPLIAVTVSVPGVYRQVSGPDSSGKALIDTGAMLTTISPAAVARMRPPTVGALHVARSGGAADWCRTHSVRVKPVIAGGRWMDVLEAASIQPASPGVDVILGCDVLRRLVPHWDGPAGVAWLGQAV